MLDVGWSELVVIGVVALIVIGPKDLPEMFRTLGRFTGKLRSMARDFQRAMESAADQSGMKDVAKDLKSATSAKSLGLDAVKEAAAKFEKWDPLKPVAAKPVIKAQSQSAAAAATAAMPALVADTAPVSGVADAVKTADAQATAEKVASANRAAGEKAEAARRTKAAAAETARAVAAPDAQAVADTAAKRKAAAAARAATIRQAKAAARDAAALPAEPQAGTDA